MARQAQMNAHHTESLTEISWGNQIRTYVLQDSTEPDQCQTASEGVVETSVDSVALQDGKITEKGKDKEGKGKDRDDREKSKDAEKEKGKEKDTDKKADKDKDKVKGLDGTNLDTLIQRLSGCVSRDLIDQLTVEFCYLNSKSNRKKLVRALFNVPRTSLELLPYYSRMVATLSTCMKDISSMLVQMLEEEFNFLINKKTLEAQTHGTTHLRDKFFDFFCC